MNRINLIGQKFGYVTVTNISNTISDRRKKWECLCDCGNICYFHTSKLNGKGRTPSCGCKTNLNKQQGQQKAALNQMKDLTNRKINNLTVIKFNGYKKSNNTRFKSIPYWLVKCDCGNEFSIQHKTLTKNNAQKYCIQCTHKNKQIHGLSDLPEYHIYNGMKRRCYNTEDSHYPNYGGRGITVCDRWLESPQNFINDMGLRPSEEYSIERINVNGNYEPSNCKWLLIKQQARNTTKSVLTLEIVKELKLLKSYELKFRQAFNILKSKYPHITMDSTYDVWRNKSWIL